MEFPLKKQKFVSKIPAKFHNLTVDNMTPDLMNEIKSHFPDIKTPSYVDSEFKKGHISESKRDEILKKVYVNEVNSRIEKEKKEFETNKGNKLFSKKPDTAFISVYESSVSGILSEDECEFLLEALK